MFDFTQSNSVEVTVTDFSSKKPWILKQQGLTKAKPADNFSSAARAEGVDDICLLEALFSFATFELKSLSL